MDGSTGHPASGGGKPPLEVGDIFRVYGEVFRQTHSPSAAQAKVMRDIEACRTAALGGHLDVCTSCGYSRPSYNSCRNRHCPKCQALDQARWIAGRKIRVLPVRHFHVVFTLPKALRPLAMANPRVVFDILFQTAARTLLEFGDDPRWLGGQLGISVVLHTWTRELQFHPHAHCVVTDGGLTRGDARWVNARGRGKFLFPVKAVSKVFRAKFVAALACARAGGHLRLAGALASDAGFAALRKKLFKHNWVVYTKRPFGGAEHLYEYLGRYTHRVGISNHRLVAMDTGEVRFRTRGDATVTIPAVEFIRRFLLHVLPKGFVKIRHYGLYASSNVQTRLAAARHQLGARVEPPPPPPPLHSDFRELFAELTGIDLLRCPMCKLGVMERRPLPETTTTPPINWRWGARPGGALALVRQDTGDVLGYRRPPFEQLDSAPPST